jgi:multiple antibiotic resistance protein
METLSITVTLFLIMDPFGNIPIFLSVLDKVRPERRRTVLIRELLLALVVIAGFIFAGKYVMTILGLQREAVSIAGGIILFLIAVRMVFPRREADSEAEFEGEPLLVPLAVPLVAGPSMLATLLLLSSAGTIGLGSLFLAAFIAWAGNFVVLYGSTALAAILTRRGLIALERLMGMILVALAVQMFLDGLAGYVN